VTKYNISFDAELTEEDVIEEQLLLGEMYGVKPTDVKITQQVEKYRTFADTGSLAEADRFVERNTANLNPPIAPKIAGW
jgi:hypothetical protein